MVDFRVYSGSHSLTSATCHAEVSLRLAPSFSTQHQLVQKRTSGTQRSRARNAWDCPSREPESWSVVVALAVVVVFFSCRVYSWPMQPVFCCKKCLVYLLYSVTHGSTSIGFSSTPSKCHLYCMLCLRRHDCIALNPFGNLYSHI